MPGTLSDVRYALRGLLRAPAFTATVVLTLGLGIGINTSVFTILNAALLAPLPYERPEELVDLAHRVRTGTPMEGMMLGLSWTEVHQWRRATDIFQGVEAFNGRGAEKQWRERDRTVRVGAFTPGLPALLGLTPRVGRVFSPDEVTQKAPVVVISESLWGSAFDRRPDVLGASMTLDGVAVTVIGVMPSAFRYVVGGDGSLDAWTGLAERGEPGTPGSGYTSPIFRLRTGLSHDDASSIATRIAAEMQREQPAPEPWTPVLLPIEDRTSTSRERIAPIFRLLLAATLAVLLVACANVANLLTTRGSARRQELAIRAALGASRLRLARLTLCEGAIVALLGMAAALVLASWTVDIVVSLVPQRMAAGLFAVSLPTLDWRVLSFTLGMAMVMALLSAVWPAWRSTHGALSSVGKDGHRVAGTSVERRRLSAALQAVQVALALVLTTAAALFATSLHRMLTTDMGFDPNGLVGVSVELPRARYATPASQQLAFAQMLERIRATPGVSDVTLGRSPVNASSGRFVRSGGTDAPGGVSIRYASPGYFSTIGARLVAGRDFGSEDTLASPHVAIIDEAGARTLFPGESPLGRRFSYSPYVPELTIVGVVTTVATSDFTTSSRPGVWFPWAQQPAPFGTILARVDGDPSAFVKAARDTLVAFEPAVRVSAAGPVIEDYERAGTYAMPRFFRALVAMFAFIGIATAAVGLYGVLSYAVGRREREIGVRLALGSTTGGIRRLVVADALRPVVIGLVIGGAIAWMAGGALQAYLYGVSVRDPFVFLASAAVLTVAAVLATLAPIRRATRVDPIHALRAE